MEIWYQDCDCGNNVKCGLLSKHLFQRTQKYGGWKSPQSSDEFFKKTVSFSYHMEEKTFIKASCINNMHNGEKGFSGCNL